MNWALCMFCQEVKGETLVNPKIYDNVSQNITAFYDLKQMPIKMNLPFMENSDKLKQALITNSAKWHKSCNMQFSTSRLKRLIPKSQADTENEPPVKKKRLLVTAGILSHLILILSQHVCSVISQVFLVINYMR